MAKRQRRELLASVEEERITHHKQRSGVALLDQSKVAFAPRVEDNDLPPDAVRAATQPAAADRLKLTAIWPRL